MSYFDVSSPSSSSAVFSPETRQRRFSSGTPEIAPQYALSPEYTHLVEEEGMKAVIAQKIAKLQDSLPQLSHSKLRQARADITYLLSIYQGEDTMIAQCRAGGVFSAPA
ncbi:hypothetical protein CI109_101484 [Kwoniella shandongensis]|uniref:Uncharacterized protein n=1 Tax=Kwoniella shandongensis TaxID=1734106 RepID=A0A5M6C8G5_9TREE|nr:uncharacterized protein CI109_001924 [Kwoniella shandongensis]KAA5529499.1 hypothetical protein CI109_001924 [Kwoniella shandongensis]